MNKLQIYAAIAVFSLSSFANADEAKVRALEQACEAAREEKLKPLREAEVAKCKTDSKNDPGYCERYWSDFGNAKRLPNGTMQPRMFGDLPECIAAEAARRKLN